MYHVFSNRIIRVIVCILLVCVFFIVPSEHKMLEAGAAFTASIAISVICAVLVAMGFTFGRAFLSDGSDAAFSKYSRTFAINSMRDLATDIFNAHSAEILSLLAYSFPGGMPNVTGANIIVMIAPALYTLVKKYIVNRFGNTSDEIEDGLNKTYGYVGNPFSYNGYVFSHYNSDKNVILGYPCYGSVSIGNKSFYWDFVKVTDSGLYTYKAFYANGDSLKSLNTWTSYDSSSYSVVLTYRDIIAPNSEHEYGAFSSYVYYPFCSSGNDTMSTGPFASVIFDFSSTSEYQSVLRAVAGETDPDKLADVVEVDPKLFNAADYPKYVYASENVGDYLGKTAYDIASPAYDELYDSEVVDNVCRTVEWYGDKTLCPIDELKDSIPADVIGHWVAAWDEAGTLCSITCYADDDSVAWTGSVESMLTWADVISRLGDISVTGSIAGSISGSVSGTLAAPDIAFNFDPLKIAGDTFSKKFPFCLPFDLYRAFKQFDYDSDGKAPVYELPLNFGETFGTHYIVLDMTKWTPVAKIVKWCVYISFMVSLIIITKNIMGGS